MILPGFAFMLLRWEQSDFSPRVIGCSTSERSSLERFTLSLVLLGFLLWLVGTGPIIGPV